MQSGFDFERVELFYHAIGARGELLVIIRRPPHRKISVCIEPRTLIVEAVRHFMANDGTDASVIECIVSFWIIERRLKDSGWENDFVVLWIVISIDRRWRHSPFGLINRPADLSGIAAEIELAR